MHKKHEKFATVRAARGSFSLRFTAHRSLRKSEIPGRGVSCLPNSRSRNRPVALATSESAQKHFFGLQSEELNRHAAFRGELRRQPQYRVTEQGPTVRTTSLNLLYRPLCLRPTQMPFVRRHLRPRSPFALSLITGFFCAP